MQRSKPESVEARLAKAFQVMEKLLRDRITTRDPNLGKAVEQRIVQRELLDLELQEIDEQIERICRLNSVIGA
jgi:hypothetical protein